MSYIKAYLRAFYCMFSIVSIGFLLGNVYEGSFLSIYLLYIALTSGIAGPVSVLLGFEK